MQVQNDLCNICRMLWSVLEVQGEMVLTEQLFWYSTIPIKAVERQSMQLQCGHGHQARMLHHFHISGCKHLWSALGEKKFINVKEIDISTKNKNYLIYKLKTSHKIFFVKDIDISNNCTYYLFYICFTSSNMWSNYWYSSKRRHVGVSML